jgi:hypothetical protein
MRIFKDLIPRRILGEFFQPQPIDQTRNARLPGPEPRRPKVEIAVIKAFSFDPSTDAVACFDKQIIMARSLKRRSEGKTGQPATND